MVKMIACCGIDCVQCPAFQATLKDDHEARAKIAREWSTPERPLEPSDVYCDGCMSGDGRRISFCDGCGIRKCSMEKNLGNCASCDSYRCDMLKASHDRSPQAFETLEGIRKSLG